MAAGDNMDYSPNAQTLWHTALAKIMGLMTSAYNERGVTSQYTLERKICVNVSQGGPSNDTDTDRPNALGDFCLHYDTSGALQDVYVCTEWSESGANCTWTVLSKGAET